MVGTGEEVLVHCKLDDAGGGLVTVRSPNRTLAESVCKELKTLMSS